MQYLISTFSHTLHGLFANHTHQVQAVLSLLKNAVTHKNNNDKTSQTVRWTAPADTVLSSDVVFRFIFLSVFTRNFRFELTKVQIRVTPPPQMKTSDLSKVQIRVPPPHPQNEDFRFELTKVEIRVPPPFLLLVGVSVCGDLYLSYG